MTPSDAKVIPAIIRARDAQARLPSFPRLFTAAAVVAGW